MFIFFFFFFKLHHVTIHGTGGMSVLAKRQDALHWQTIDPGDHGQEFRSTPDILPRI